MRRLQLWLISSSKANISLHLPVLGFLHLAGFLILDRGLILCLRQGQGLGRKKPKGLKMHQIKMLWNQNVQFHHSPT